MECIIKYIIEYISTSLSTSLSTPLRSNTFYNIITEREFDLLLIEC